MKKNSYGQWTSAFSLDAECYEILSKVPNKSAYVRMAIKAAEMPPSDHHIQKMGSGSSRLCNPFHVKGVCAICWPDGEPTKEAWMHYLEMSRLGREARKPPSIRVEAIATEGRPNKQPDYQPFAVLGWLVAMVTTGIALGMHYL